LPQEPAWTPSAMALIAATRIAFFIICFLNSLGLRCGRLTCLGFHP
jgi:hypothetical protein